MSYYEKVADEHEYFYARAYEAKKTIKHFHSSLEFAFCKEGEFSVTISGEKIFLSKNEGVFIDGFTIHSYEDGPNSKGYFIVAEKDFFVRSFSFFNGVPPRKFKFENVDLLNCITDCYNEKGLTDSVKKARFYGLSSILVSEIAQKNAFVSNSKSRQEENLCKILEYIERNLKEEISLSTLSKKFGYSKEHLSRLLNKVLGVGFLEYINVLRVKQAKKLLDKKDGRTVIEIAYLCGFNSPNTFYRAYKKVYGISPKKV